MNNRSVVKHKSQFANRGNFAIDMVDSHSYTETVSHALDEFRTPGQFLQYLLELRGWTQRVLALVLGIDETGLNKIIAGKRPLDAEIALPLSQVFGIPPEDFLELQTRYDLAMARVTARPDPGLTTRATLFGDLPVSDMIKRGWLRGITDIRQPDVEKALCRFFGVSAVDEIEILPHAAKKTNVAERATPSQLAWLYQVRRIAKEILVGKYSQASAEDIPNKFKPLLGSPEAARKVPRILHDSGIRFVVVESLPGAKIDGVCFWLNDHAPVIGLSMRHDRIDNFWFVLRHELEHAIRGHGRVAAMLDTNLEGDRAGTGPELPEEERVANQAAADFCVPQRQLEKFIRLKGPFFAERDIRGFAATYKIHPGLVAGQLQHKTGRYELFRNHLVKIRSAVTPNAMMDGWGDVAPIGN
jgi:HTH-type transcriptional regulator/antitoxin HigA